MLVLHRKPNESITFPGLGVTITQLDDFRIGIEAPPEVLIVRTELLSSPGNHASPVEDRSTDSELKAA